MTSGAKGLFLKKLFGMLVCCGALCALLLAGCGGGGGDAGGPPPTAEAGDNPANTTLRVQLNQAHNPEFAGLYLAVEKGYYAEEGLSVEFIPAQPADGSETAGQAVLAGEAQFGVGGGDMILRLRSSLGEQGDLQAIASIYQINPLGILSLPEAGIHRPSDLAGKKIGVYSKALNSSLDIQFSSLLQRMKIERASLELAPLNNPYNFSDLTQKHVQAAAGFSAIQQGLRANLAGTLFNQILYLDYGVPIYPNLIFTSGTLMRQNPDLVQRFTRATLRGYQAAIQSPDEAARATQAFAAQGGAGDSGDEELRIYSSMALAQIPFIDPGGTPLGWMDAGVWQATQDLLIAQNIIPAALDLEGAYTNRFVSPTSGAEDSGGGATETRTP